MLSEIVQVGDKIEIKQLDHNGELINNSKVYVSQLVDYIDDEKISIAAPIKNGRIILLEKGPNYRLYFYTAKGLYQTTCTLIQTYRENNMIISLVKLNSDLEKIQRRQYYRLECIHDIDYRLISEEEIRLEEKLSQGNYASEDEKIDIKNRLNKLNNEWVHGIITDISGGGCRFNSEQELKAGDRVRIRFNYTLMGQLKELDIISHIIASQKIMGQIRTYEHRAEFYTISNKEREDLIKYIFEQERKRMRFDKK